MMTEAETRIARTFRPRDWVPLTTAFIRIMSFVDGRADLALACINRDLREEVLHAALVASDGTIKMLFEGSDWQRRTVHAPHIPAEGVRVEPYEEGRFFIWRADLDKEYPTNPASAADRQQPPPAAPDMDVPAPATSATQAEPVASQPATQLDEPPQAEAQYSAVMPAVEHPAQDAPRRGRPSSAPLVLEEAKQRLQGSDRALHIQRGREHFLAGLSEWLRNTHPKARPMAAKTIGDHLRANAEVRALMPEHWRRRT